MLLTTSHTPTAKALIQSLLLAAEGEAYPSRQLVAAGALFGISENNIRVALVRLQAQGLAEAAGRGTYRLGPAGAKLGREILAWRHIEQRIGSWCEGRFVGVHTGAMSRSDRAALQRRDRALQMMGFREVRRGLHVRPDNLQGGVATCQQRLLALGLESEAWVFALDDLHTGVPEPLPPFWSTAQLDDAYRQADAQLREWLARLPQLSPADAAREAYVLDKQAIRRVVWDPLLPDGWVDARARTAFFATVRELDAAGRSIWWRFFEFSDSQAPHLDPALAPHATEPDTALAATPTP